MPDVQGQEGGGEVRFQEGEVVIEVLGNENKRTDKATRIVGLNADQCMTGSGRWYDRLTGEAVTKGKEYRAIHSAAYKR